MWPGGFERMEQFIQDTGLTAADLELNYDDVVEMFGNGQLAMYFGSSAGVGMFQEQGIDATFCRSSAQNGEKWLMTTPYFQVALNRDLEQGRRAARKRRCRFCTSCCRRMRRNRSLRKGQDLLSYSQSVSYHLYRHGRMCARWWKKPYVYPHRLQRFLCHLAGCGFQDDCGRI